MSTVDKRPSRNSRRDLTTGQVAKLAGVAPRTVAKWMEAGLINGRRLPGSEERRFSPEDVQTFLERNGYRGVSVPGLVSVGQPSKVFLVGVPKASRGDFLIDGVAASFSVAGPMAGIAMLRYRPEIVVIDASMGRIEVVQHAEAARSVGAVVVLYGDADGLDKSAFNAWIESPEELPPVVAMLEASKED